jgi:hypothetical protein
MADVVGPSNIRLRFARSKPLERFRTLVGFARVLPSLVRARISERSNSASPPSTVSMSLPCGVVVSAHASANDLPAPALATSSSTLSRSLVEHASRSSRVRGAFLGRAILKYYAHGFGRARDRHDNRFDAASVGARGPPISRNHRSGIRRPTISSTEPSPDDRRLHQRIRRLRHQRHFTDHLVR